MQAGQPPIGAVLAGGLGSRLGGSKATATLCGRPLAAFAVAALREAVGEVVVVAKRDSELPALPGVVRWNEPDDPRHPLAGIVHALRCATGRPVLVCALDMPLIGRAPLLALAGALARADSPSAAVLAHAGQIEPLAALYAPAALGPLGEALAGDAAIAARAAVLALDPLVCELDDELALMNVNTPADLARAAAELERGGEAGT